MEKLKILHMYPNMLDLYGDSGNVEVLSYRCKMRGIELEVSKHLIGDKETDFTQYDIIYLGGGADFEQQILADDLVSCKDSIMEAYKSGTFFLMICGGYQLMGHYYDTAAGVRCAGVDVLDLTTEGAEERMIGNFAFETEFGSVVGFENHSGRTRLGPNAKPLGRVLRGFGNNGEDGGEGARYKNVFGTYSHGPVLPKNPDFCDGILLAALRRRYGDAELSPLEDLSEREAHESVLSRLLG